MSEQDETPRGDFLELEALHIMLDYAQKSLETEIGCAICIPTCGKCCETLGTLGRQGMSAAHDTMLCNRGSPLPVAV